MSIAILGRPNVGKSSLFNRLCKRSLAIVNSQEGTTRDRLYGEIRAWDSVVHVIDTGGVDQESPDRFQKQIHKQALAAAEEASILLLVVDIRCGITKQDEELAKRLLALKKPLIEPIQRLVFDILAKLLLSSSIAPRRRLIDGLLIVKVTNIG